MLHQIVHEVKIAIMQRSYTPDSIARGFELYKKELAELNAKDDKPTPFLITGFCVYMGISRQTLSKYSKEKDYADIICKIREYAEHELLVHGLKGKVSPVICKFALQNLHDWADKQETKQDLIVNYESSDPEKRKELLEKAIEVLKNA